MQLNNSTIDNNQYNELNLLNNKIEQIVELLQTTVRLLNVSTNNTDERIWTTDDVANWLKLSKDTIYKKIVVRDDFPAPIASDNSSKALKQRWIASSVIKWATQNVPNLPKSKRKRTII